MAVAALLGIDGQAPSPRPPTPGWICPARVLLYTKQPCVQNAMKLLDARPVPFWGGSRPEHFRGRKSKARTGPGKKNDMPATPCVHRVSFWLSRTSIQCDILICGKKTL